MCLIVITPTQSAEDARKKLADAQAKLAAALVAIADAESALEMFEHNFRVGAYQERKQERETVTWIPPSP